MHAYAYAHRILIDLDASCKIGEPAGQKVTSSAFFPPEMARYELEKASGSVVEEVIASETFEMWYFGLLLLQMCTKDAPTLFQATQADNLIHNSDFHSLAYLWDTIKLERIGECFLSGKQAVDKEWSPAIDLCLWCLQGRSER